MANSPASTLRCGIASAMSERRKEGSDLTLNEGKPGVTGGVPPGANQKLLNLMVH